MPSPKRLLNVAVLLLAAYSTNSIAAVHINPQGLGEVLLFPYYTTTGGHDTYINLVNTRSETKALKLRIRESMNGRSVFEMNLYLAPQDHWSAVIYLSGAGDGVMLRTADHSCTVPLTISQGEEISLSTQGFQEDSVAGWERTREGFVEVIEMAVIGPGASIDNDWPAKIKPDRSGFPPDCDSIASAWAVNGAWSRDRLDGASNATGGLYGYGILIDVSEGTEASYDAIAADNFVSPEGSPLHYSPQSLLPTLLSGDTDYSLLSDGEWVYGSADSGIDAVSSVLMQATLANDFIMEPTVAAATDWVITFPTKHEYVNTEIARPPFTAGWSRADSAACEEFFFSYFSREGQSPFAPLEPPRWDWEPPFLRLCAQANVFNFGSSNPSTGILEASEERNRKTVFLEEGFENGWGQIDFVNYSGTRPALVAGANALEGLPVIGFSLHRFVNGKLTFDGQPVLSNYVGVTRHRGQVTVGEP